MYKLKIEKLTEEFNKDIENSWNRSIKEYNEEYNHNKYLYEHQEIFKEEDKSKENFFTKMIKLFKTIFNFLRDKVSAFIISTINFLKDKMSKVSLTTKASKETMDKLDGEKKKQAKDILDNIISKSYGSTPEEIDKIINSANTVKESYEFNEEVEQVSSQTISILKIQKVILNGLHCNQIKENSYLVDDGGGIDIPFNEYENMVRTLANTKYDELKNENNIKLSMFNDTNLKENINKLTNLTKVSENTANKAFVSRFYTNIMNGLTAKEIMINYKSAQTKLNILNSNNKIIEQTLSKMINLLEEFEKGFQGNNNAMKMIGDCKNSYMNLSNYTSRLSSYETHVISDINVLANSYNSIVKVLAR